MNGRVSEETVLKKRKSERSAQNEREGKEAVLYAEKRMN
jgi:hypothetical protein